MNKPIDPNSHAILDYAFGISCLAIPVVAGFNLVSSIASYAIGVTQIGMSLFTNYPVSAVKAIPFKVHSMIELGTAVQLLTVPAFTRALDPRAKTFFVSSGLALLAIYLMTDYSDEGVVQAQIELDEMREEGIHKIEQVVDNPHVPDQIKELVRRAS